MDTHIVSEQWRFQYNLVSTLKISNFNQMSNVFRAVVLIEIADTVNKYTNISNRTQTIKNPNWWEAADQLVIYKTRSRS